MLAVDRRVSRLETQCFRVADAPGRRRFDETERADKENGRLVEPMPDDPVDLVGQPSVTARCWYLARASVHNGERSNSCTRA